MSSSSRARRFVVLSILCVVGTRCSTGSKESLDSAGASSPDGVVAPVSEARAPDVIGPGDGKEILLLKMESVQGVLSNPPQITTFTLAQTSFITRVWTYHYNATIGASKPTVSFKNTKTGAIFGPWAQTGHKSYASAAGATANDPGNIPGPPDNYWAAYPAMALPAGTYQVVDSVPATWSYTSDLGNRGVAWVYGYVGTGVVSPPDAGAPGRLDGGAVDLGLPIDGAAADVPDTSVAPTSYVATVTPSAQATTVAVGPAVTITVPGGLFTQAATFTATRLQTLPSTPPKPNQLLDAWSVTCSQGSTFAQELTLEFGYDPTLLDPGLAPDKGIFLAYWDETALGWVQVPVKVDTVAKRLVAKTSHLSTWVYWSLHGYYNVATAEQHFTIYYDPTVGSPLVGADMTIAQFAAHVGQLMEQAYKAYADAHFTMPSSWFPGALNVIITDDTRWAWQTFSLGGYNFTYETPAESSPAYSGFSGNILLKRGHLTSDDAIKADGAHELFHAVQNQYTTVSGIHSNLWWYEGTTDLASYEVAWQRSLSLPAIVDNLSVDYFDNPIIFNQDTHAYQLAYFLDYLRTDYGLQFKPLWDAVEKRSDPLTGLSMYVTQNTSKTFDQVWAAYVARMYFNPPIKYTAAYIADLHISTSAPTLSRTLTVEGGYTVHSIRLRGEVAATESSIGVAVSTSATLPAAASVQVWYLPGGRLASANLKQVLNGAGSTGSTIDLAKGDELYLLAMNTGAAAVSVPITVVAATQTPNDNCHFAEDAPTAVTLALATSKCNYANTFSLCFTPGAGGSIQKSSEPGCEDFVDNYELTGSYSCNSVNLTYSFLDEGSVDFPGCSAAKTVTRKIVYDGTASLTWDAASASYTVGSATGTYQSSYSSVDCRATFPTCSASDLKVTAAE
jgi:hypothetical protein